MSLQHTSARTDDAAVFEISVDGELHTVSFPCRADESVLTSMSRKRLSVVPVGCRGGGCGVCTVTIIEGSVERGKMSRAHVSQAEEESGSRVLACKIYPRSDLRLKPTGKLFRKLKRKIGSSEKDKVLI